jgi:L,D-peptidoglycan transpeptidase YkuD (ErfK/YbiS/YcfS/YnhG family)
MTPKPFLVGLSVLGLGVPLAACGSSPQALRAAPRTSTAHATTTEPLTPTRAVPTTTAVPTTVAPSTAVAPTATACNSNLADQLASTNQATQLIVVDASTYATTTATVSVWQREGSCWVAVFGPWTAHIGANGFSDHHAEGDDTTPTGAYGIGAVMYGNAPNPGVEYRYQQVVCGDWWDEDPNSPEYNTFQYVPCGETPSFGGDSEALWEETNVYPSFAVIDYNTSPVVPGAGSAIFIAANLGSPTEGCVGLPVDELDQLLRWLNPAAFPLIVLGPDSEITNF